MRRILHVMKSCVSKRINISNWIPRRINWKTAIRQPQSYKKPTFTQKLCITSVPLVVLASSETKEGNNLFGKIKKILADEEPGPICNHLTQSQKEIYEARMEMAVYYITSNNDRETVVHLEKFLDIAYSSPQELSREYEILLSYLIHGIVFQNSADYSPLVSILKNTIDSHPDLKQDIVDILTLSLLEKLENFVGSDNGSNSIKLLLGHTCKNLLNDKENAISYFNNIISKEVVSISHPIDYMKNKDIAIAHFNLGVLHMNDGNEEKVARYFSDSIKIGGSVFTELVKFECKHNFNKTNDDKKCILDSKKYVDMDKHSKEYIRVVEILGKMPYHNYHDHIWENKKSFYYYDQPDWKLL